MASASERPLVSIITPFLDAERFFAEAIESVRAQTYDRWELVLVDDGSRDASRRIAEEYAARDPERIRVIEHPGRENRGSSAARNLGFTHARGEVIALLDADDVYLPGKLAHQVTLLEAHPEAGAVYGTTQYWYGWTGRAEDLARDRARRRGIAADSLVMPGTVLGRILRNEARTPCTCGVVMRRGAVVRAGGFEDSFRGMYDDQVFFLKLFATSAVWVDGACHDRYRQHPDSMCHRARAAGEWDGSDRPTEFGRRFLEWLAAYVDAQGIEDRSLRRELARQRRAYSNPVGYRLAKIAERLSLTRRRRSGPRE
jgi:glycosyltransferase involved in cell wall biosynthesis